MLAMLARSRCKAAASGWRFSMAISICAIGAERRTTPRQHIPYRLEAQGSQILVPQDQVPRARVLLAKEGLPSGGSIGYEIFDRGDGLTANQFQQQ